MRVCVSTHGESLKKSIVTTACKRYFNFESVNIQKKIRVCGRNKLGLT